MRIQFAISQQDAKGMDTEQLRENFLVQYLFSDDQISLVYTHYDRVIIGGVKPVNKTIDLPNHPELRADYFLERRELGIINVGADGSVIADGKEFALRKMDCVYLGKGTQKVRFRSESKKDAALFYFLSAPAHHKYPNRVLPR
jgi:4-deoxy-L-threo-5-hexosulose-uronate ketol-isomerase